MEVNADLAVKSIYVPAKLKARLEALKHYKEEPMHIVISRLLDMREEQMK